MKSYICKNCGFIVETDDILNYICPKCNSRAESFSVIEDQLNEVEIDAIIGSVMDEVNAEEESKIINNTDNDKYVMISQDNKCIVRNNEKCINCGHCKKICEKIANITYDLNKSKNPICIGCGKCVLECPTGAISIRSDVEVIKNLINENKKIIVGVLYPEVSATLKELNDSTDINYDKKVVKALKNIGFDYIYNGSCGNDIYVMKESYELLKRIQENNDLPMISGYCPSWKEYMNIYHKELQNNISFSENARETQCEIIKKYLCEEKGFDESKISIVVISSCLADKMDNSIIDYVLTTKELDSLINEHNIKINTLDEQNYDEIMSESSGSGKMCSISGGLTESIIRTVYYLINKKNLKKDYLNFETLRNNDEIKSLVVKIGNIDLRVAAVEKMDNFEKLLKTEQFKKYHYIEVMNCKGGCINGGGQSIRDTKDNVETLNNVKKYIIDKDNNSNFKCSHENMSINDIFKKHVQKP